MKPQRTEMADLSIENRQGWFDPWNRFWFSPADPLGLHTLRVLVGLLLLGWLLPFAGHQDALFSLAGWVDREALQAAANVEGGPPVDWSIFYLAGNNLFLVDVLYWLSILVILAFTFGFAVRVTAVLTWVVTVSFLANPATTFDADYLLVIPTLYLAIGYLLYGQFSRPATTMDRVVGPRSAWITRMFREGIPEEPSHAANFAVRLFQVHFALILVVSALHKLQMADWWSGVAFFYPLHPPFQTRPDDVRAMLPNAQNYFFFLSLAQYLMIGWQLFFPLFAWKRFFRPVLVGGGVLAWLGSVFIFRMPLFGPFTLIACLNFLSPEELRGLGQWARSVLPFKQADAPPPPQPQHRLSSNPSRAIKEVKKV